jgi:hypothetical protein
MERKQRRACDSRASIKPAPPEELDGPLWLGRGSEDCARVAPQSLQQKLDARRVVLSGFGSCVAAFEVRRRDESLEEGYCTR